MKETIKKLTISLMISGSIIFCIGCYYAIIKAGTPYQDPTIEMQIEYAINLGIGNQLIKFGFIFVAISTLIHVIIKKG